jgi:hypothetical protein
MLRRSEAATLGGSMWVILRVVLIVLIGLMATASPAQEEDAVMPGFGARSCAQLAADYKKNPQMTTLLWGTWAQGFMAAMNVQLALERKPRRNIPVDSLDATVRQMCDERAPSPFWTVVLDYFKSLRELPQ